MFSALLLVASLPLPASEFPGIELTDAYAFGVDAGSCRCLWLTAKKHPATMSDEVRSWNPPDVVQTWCAECQWRERCWCLLDDALFCEHLTVRQKLRSLSELRDLLGEADHYAGRMPDPFPHYRR